MGSVRGRYSLAFSTLAVLIATPLLLAATSGKAQRLTTVTCGETLTTSIVLANDLNCSSTALIVGANGITINLNGHSLIGDGTASGHIGVFQPATRTGVTVENGTISNWSDAILLANASNTHITGIRAANNGQGILIDFGSADVVSGNVVFGNAGSGIVLDVTGGQVTGNVVEANVNGIFLSNASSVTVSQNKALNNSGDGIRLVGFTSETLTGNVAEENGGNGISASGVNEGITTLTGNRASFNGKLGINAAPGLKDGGGNVVQDNTTATQCANISCDEVSN